MNSESFNPEECIGLTEKEAQNLAKINGFKTRLVEKDGVAYIVTCDFCTDRINLVINNNIVTDSYIG